MYDLVVTHKFAEKGYPGVYAVGSVISDKDAVERISNNPELSRNVVRRFAAEPVAAPPPPPPAAPSRGFSVDKD